MKNTFTLFSLLFLLSSVTVVYSMEESYKRVGVPLSQWAAESPKKTIEESQKVGLQLVKEGHELDLGNSPSQNIVDESSTGVWWLANKLKRGLIVYLGLEQKEEDAPVESLLKDDEWVVLEVDSKDNGVRRSKK